MKYAERLILFIDILGFTNRIQASSESYNIDNIKTTLEYIRDLFISENGTGIEFTQFSDSILISTDKKYPGGLYYMVENASFAYHALLIHGFISKGVIMTGELYHDNDILFGPGFMKAMKQEALEDNPIIKFHEDLLQLARTYPSLAQKGAEDEEIGYILNHASKIS